MEDEQIVALYWARSEDAISRTQEKYHPYLMKIAWNILYDHQDSQESVNDTYLAAWNSMPPHRPNVLSAYLAKLARRICIDCFRFRSREKRGGSQYALSLEELSECLSGGNVTEEVVEGQLLAETIARFLKQQDELTRRAFLGRYYFLDPLKEVAAYCGMSESKAKSLLFRTRNKLKAFLIQEGYCL